jgi:hypothetical protein
MQHSNRVAFLRSTLKGCVPPPSPPSILLFHYAPRLGHVALNPIGLLSHQGPARASGILKDKSSQLQGEPTLWQRYVKIHHRLLLYQSLLLASSAADFLRWYTGILIAPSVGQPFQCQLSDSAFASTSGGW